MSRPLPGEQADRARWYPAGRLAAALTDHTLGWPALAAVVGGLCLAVGSLIYLPSWAPWLLLLPVLGLAGMVRGRRWGWRLDAAGLRETRIGQRTRLYPWPTIREVRETAFEIEIDAGDETLRLPRFVRGHGDLLRRLLAGLGQAGPEREEVTPGQVAAWLGIGLDESLPLRPRFRDILFRLVLPVGYVVMMVRSTLEYGGLLMPALAVISVCLWPALFSELRSVRVTARGLAIGSRRRVSWDDVTAVKPNGQWSWRLETEQGDIALVGPEAQRVAMAAERVISAKRAGQVLPRMTDIPEHALSRAESVEVSAERGISAAEGDGR